MQRRNDIQGLRALAVILVILSHLEFQSGAFRGGYIGVDVFFVISGYIITSLLIREYSRNADANSGYGWISLRAFYFRRVKRIIPVASIVLITTISSSYFLFNSVKAGWIRNDGLFASIFLANVNLIQQKTDYFSQSLAQSPLEHYWSLSVEEQFYLVIPFLILMAVSFHGVSIGKFKLWWERRVISLLGAITLFSFIWSLIQTSSNPQSAYFSTLTRAWEIGAGGLLAVITFQKESLINKRIANLIAFVCLMAILISSFILDSNSRFPGYAALIPVSATALLIYIGGENPKNFVSRLLSLRPLVYIGEISFSLYLWHLPIIVILGQNFQLVKNPALESAILILITFALTLASFYFVEKPCRDYPMPASWEPKPKMSEHGAVKLSWFFNDLKVRRIIVGILCFTFLVGGYKTAANVIYARPMDKPSANSDFNNPGDLVQQLSQNSDNSSLTSGNEFDNQTFSNDLELLQDSSDPLLANLNSDSNPRIEASNSTWANKIREGITLSQAPSNIVENLSTLTIDRAFSSSSCRKVELKDFQAKSEAVYCVKKLEGKPLALFIGNSHGAMMQDAMGKVLNDLGFSQEGIFTSSCTISPKVIPLLNSSPVNKCKNFGDDLAQYVKNKKPDIIIISQSLNVSFLNESGQSIQGVAAQGFLTTTLQNALTGFRATTKKIILLDAFPQLPKISTCLGVGDKLNQCVSKTADTNIYREINRNLAETNTLPLISPLGWLCDQGRCPAIINGVLVSPDGSHITPEFVPLITPLLRNQMSIALTNIEQVLNVGNPKASSLANNQKYESALALWQTKISLSVGQLSTKNLVPSFSQSASKDVFTNPDCGQRFTITGIAFDGLNPCKSVGGSKNAVFLGNSHARMLLSTVAGGLKLNGYNTYSISTGSCTLADVTPVINGAPVPNCDRYRADAAALIQRIKPTIIVVSESISNILRGYLPPGVSSTSGISSDKDRFWKEYQKSMTRLASGTNKMIVFGQVPYLASDPIDCVDSNGKMSSDCIGKPNTIEDIVNPQKSIIKSIGDFIDMRDWLCTSSACPAIIDNTLVYTDLSHLSFPIQSKLLPIFDLFL